MFKKKKVILSFDYELFFGDRSGTVLKTLIEPTNKILDAMDSVGFKGNFFIDWQMLKYLKEANTERTDSDLKMIVDQLKDIVRRGHRIELHIHPHWVDAKYNGDGTWDFSDFHHYSLNSFAESEIVDMFVEGAGLLESIASDVEPDYKVVAFRAGGWCVQPFDKLRKGFEAAGIKIDSSTMPGLSIIAENSKCDFINAPKTESGFYRFSDDVCKIDESGPFIEVPITSYKRNFWMKVCDKVMRNCRGIPAPTTDGTHARAHDKEDIWLNPQKLGISTFSSFTPLQSFVIQLFQYSSLRIFIDHPKDFSKYTCSSIKAVSLLTNTALYKDLA